MNVITDHSLFVLVNGLTVEWYICVTYSLSDILKTYMPVFFGSGIRLANPRGTEAKWIQNLAIKYQIQWTKREWASFLSHKYDPRAYQ